METILYNISQVVGIAIIHSLWQGLVIYLFLRLLLLSFSSLSAKTKHNIGMMAMLALTTWFIYTLAGEIRVYQWVQLKADSHYDILPAIMGMPLHIPHQTAYSSRIFYTIEGILPYVTLIYIAGLLFNTTKLIMTRRKLGDIKQTVSIDIAMMRKIAEFTEMLDIECHVSFGLSKLVDVPCVFGYVKPFILLPASIATSLSTEEIEAILLHELAHIKRNDYLANLFQQVMTVLLFFNPFAQLINRIVNRERENACDDIVIESTQKPIVYAHALLKLEESRTQQWQLALAATGKKKYQLLNRIERIMKTKKPIGNARHILLAFVVLTASITGLAWLNPTIAHGKLSFNKIKPSVITELFSDTTHKKATKTAHRSYTRKAPKTTTQHYKEYSDEYNDDDPQMQKFSQEMSKYGEEMSKYFNSGAWKKFETELSDNGKKLDAYYNSEAWKKYEQDLNDNSKKLDDYYNSDTWKNYEKELNENSKKIEDYYNSPQWKELSEKQEKLSENFSKNWGETPETKAWSEKMEKIGKDLERYYNTPEFKAMDARLRKKYNIPADKYGWNSDDMKDENYQKYQDELNANLPASIKQETGELKELGSKMRDHFRSPEMRKQREQLRMMSDSMRHMSHNGQLKEIQDRMRQISAEMRTYQNSPELKQVQENMRKASQAMKVYQNNPELKQIQENMHKASAAMRAYQNSPEFKQLKENMRLTQQKMREYMNSPAFKVHMEVLRNMNRNFNDDYEKPEKPEKPEQPEKPEAPEKPEKPDTSGNN
jgi:bla regulator protein BlaR1